MIRIILSGCCGRMGKCVASMCRDKSEEYRIVAGVDVAASDETCGFPVYADISLVTEKADVIIDFSFHAVTEKVLAFAERSSLPVVLCTTGHTPEELDTVSAYSKKVAIFKSANMSVGIALMTELCKRAALTLGDDFDIELVEKHHNQKLDAPSGTALMIADAISSVLPEKYEYVYDRHSKHEKRTKKEIGISSVRAGTIVGEHEVIFGGRDEIITVSHTALSREVFASGALRAAKYMCGKKMPAGFYNMETLLADEFM